MRRKIPKTLSGIETQIQLENLGKHLAGKYLKPYQGLKHTEKSWIVHDPCRKIPKTLSGIETHGGC